MARARLLHGGAATHAAVAPSGNGKIDIIRHYEAILGHPHGDAAQLATAPGDLIQWVIPNFGRGSGGHLNIFRFMNMLSRRGLRQRLVILPPYGWDSPDAARRAIEDWYFPLDAEVALGIDGFAPADITMATGWQTAYWVAKHRASRDKFYFVQDFEPFFAPISSEYYLAENTYRLGLKGITAGTWLSTKLSQDYGMLCRDVSFGVDHDRYYPRDVGDRSGDNFNILFYSRHVTPRRLFEIGLLALNKVCQAEPRAAVIFAGGDVGGIEVPFHHLNAGELKLEALPDLYARCDLALVLSGTNLSLLPLELVASGCPVVMNDTPSARWLLPEDAAFYAAPDPDALAQTILAAIANEDDRRARLQRAQKQAAAASWDAEGERLIAHLAELRAMRAPAKVG